MGIELKDGSYLLSKEQCCELMYTQNIYYALRSLGVYSSCDWGEHPEYRDSSFNTKHSGDE